MKYSVLILVLSLFLEGAGRASEEEEGAPREAVASQALSALSKRTRPVTRSQTRSAAQKVPRRADDFVTLFNQTYERQIQEMKVSYQNLKGKLPKDLFALTGLTGLDLSLNTLRGEISKEIGCLVNLEYLNISFNKLQGSLPREMMTLVTLKSLSLMNNLLAGDIPEEISHLTSLRALNLSHNTFTGEILSKIEGLTTRAYA